MVPDMTMLKLKSDNEPVSAATFRMSVAGTIEPASKVVPSWLQVKVRGELANEGFQFIVIIFSVSETLPVFLM